MVVLSGGLVLGSGESMAALQPNGSLDFFTDFGGTSGNNSSATINDGSLSATFSGHIGVRPDGPLYFQDARSFWVEEDNVDGSVSLSQGATLVQFVARDRLLSATDPNGVIQFLDTSSQAINVDVEVYDALTGLLLAGDSNHGTNKNQIGLSNDWVRYVVKAAGPSTFIGGLSLTNDDSVGRSAIDDFGFNVPEPTSIAVMGMGLMFGLRPRRRG